MTLPGAKCEDLANCVYLGKCTNVTAGDVCAIVVRDVVFFRVLSYIFSFLGLDQTVAVTALKESGTVNIQFSSDHRPKKSQGR